MRRWILLTGLIVWAQTVRAEYGLRTTFAEVSVEGVKIGTSFSMLQSVNKPLRVMNSGTEALDLLITPELPLKDETRTGFEPIPSTDWIKLQASTFTVPPGVEAVSDVVVEIPNEPELLGRRFYGYIWTRSQNLAATGVGLKSRLLISISSQKPSEEELKQKFVRKKLANLNFNLSPMEVIVLDVPLGKKAYLKDLKSGIKLVNPNSEPYTFKLVSVPLWETSVAPLKGYDAATDPKWLGLDKDVIKAEEDSIQSLAVWLQLPKEEKLKGKKLMFILRAEILEQEIPAYAYVKVFVNTEK